LQNIARDLFEAEADGIAVKRIERENFQKE